MRDHTKLKAFALADELALLTYKETRAFPSEERFTLVTQMRRAALSTASNIVEGCARPTQADYVHFLDMAYGSSRELEYQISLAHRLGYLDQSANERMAAGSESTCKVLGALIRSLRNTSDE
ncbi:MAG: four helix bundle protein [Phycisphaerae bacterium]|nr:four helix bundle protein [Phycisphaerae bacterium]